MKKRFLYLFLILTAGLFSLTACYSPTDDLPDDPIVFRSGETTVDGESYVTVEHNGKVYIPYGTIKSRGFGDLSYAYGDCLGYVGDNESDLIYALAGESTDEWLIEYLYSGLMDQPMVFRAISAAGNNIPDCVERFDDAD